MKQPSLTIELTNSNRAIKIVSGCLVDFEGADLLLFITKFLCFQTPPSVAAKN